MNTRIKPCIIVVAMVAVAIVIVSTIVSAEPVTLDVVSLLEEKALNTVVEGDSHVDPGDYTIRLDNVVIGLWKRIYGYGYVAVTSNGVLVKAAFSKASIGIAGVYVKFTDNVSSFNASLTLKIEEDYGGVIELVLHESWYNGTGGDRPGTPLTQVIIYPKYGLALIGNTQKNIGKTSVFKINVSYDGNISTLTVNGAAEKVSLEEPPRYITLMALSTDPGLNITFLLEDFKITYSTINHTKTPSYTQVHTQLNNTTSSTLTHTCTRSTPEIEPVSFATNTSTPIITGEQKPTRTIVSNATITIVYPNGSTQTSIVPVTRKQVSGELVAPVPENNLTTSKATSSVEDRVFNTTFYLILLVAVIVVAIASLVFSRRNR